MNRRRREGTGTLLAVVFSAITSLLTAAAGAEEIIYRCVHENGSLVFSDSPCDRQAQPYRAGNNLSVISAPDHLAERTAQNQAFIEQRRLELQRARRAGEPPSPAAQTQPPAAGPMHSGYYIPYGWPPSARPISPEPPPAHRDPSAEQDRFSALSGPFPGSTRRRGQPGAPPNNQ